MKFLFSVIYCAEAIFESWIDIFFNLIYFIINKYFPLFHADFVHKSNSKDIYDITHVAYCKFNAGCQNPIVYTLSTVPSNKNIAIPYKFFKCAENQNSPLFIVFLNVNCTYKSFGKLTKIIWHTDAMNALSKCLRWLPYKVYNKKMHLKNK